MCCRVNGPFPCGDWPDLRIARESLIHCLDAGEYYLADGGYNDGRQYAFTPTGYSSDRQRMEALARARHETVNRRFKVFRALKDIYRHDLSHHGSIFRAIANVTQVCIAYGISPLFQIMYAEEEEP